ncbi:GroES-like protein [Glarea lozoyensis ATCC 20868]|uniref:D-xylulose reductase n=1 Tax=Glarea lozoyensis (strain ATCC 20868 / MF5171) TaxID=1116229 RepID=S3CS24_GLAL2|nr:GroES-like protein [Glarea lozoyensis ATCC 20868]EPE27859.1 GroES-like protein [Glarea lozoyensis ATCC 20868]
MDSSFENPAVYLSGPGQASIKESPLPNITDSHSVILKIAYVGVCGSDVHFWKHGGIINKVSEANPLIMGHEASGVVHSIGSAVTTLKVGDRVAIEPGRPCRRCKPCKAGRYNLCPSMKFAADPPDSHGTLRKFYEIPEDFCYVLPPDMGLDEGVLVEPTAVAVHACRLAEVKVGIDVVIFGAGTVGLLCAAVAKAMGARKVVSVDVNESRLEFARGFASTDTFLPGSGDTAGTIATQLNTAYFTKGADLVLEATGVESCIGAGIQVLKRGGTYVQVGLGKQRIQFPIVSLSEKEINMKGCFRYNAGDYDLALHLLGGGKVRVKDLITSVKVFEDVTEAWETTARGEGIKTLIRVGGV